MGYTGRCVEMFLAGYAEAQAAGGSLSGFFPEGEFGTTNSMSAVFVKKLNLFEGQIHVNTCPGNDVVSRYWDDGLKTMPQMKWEGPDQGETSAETSWSAFGDYTWLSVEEVAQLLNTTVDEFTPDKFKQVYVDTWLKEHEDAVAVFNSEQQAELEDIEQVKNETDSTGETTTIDAASPIDDGSAGNGRKLTSATARFVSAALRVFGI